MDPSHALRPWRISLRFASLGCNKVSGALCTNRHGEIIYGGDVSVMVVNTQLNHRKQCSSEILVAGAITPGPETEKKGLQIQGTPSTDGKRNEQRQAVSLEIWDSAQYAGPHDGRVNAVQCQILRNHTVLMSADGHGKVVVYVRRDAGMESDQDQSKLAYVSPWKFLWSGQIHNAPISCLASVVKTEASPDTVVAVTMANDNSLRLIVLSEPVGNDSSWTLQVLNVGGVSLKSTFLPESITIRKIGESIQGSETYLFAFGGSESIIYLYLLDMATAVQPNQSLTATFAAKLTAHSDWIRSLDFAIGPSDDIYLASSSNDRTIRIWSIKEQKSKPDVQIANGSEASMLLDFDVSAPQKKEFFVRATHQIERQYTATSVKLLTDHTDMVTCVRWQKIPAKEAPSLSQLSLLSCSLDSSVALWKPKPFQSAQWNNSTKGSSLDWELAARFGLLGGIGTHALGFVGCDFLNIPESGESSAFYVIGHAFGGAIHTWRIDKVLVGDSASSTLIAYADHTPAGAGGHTDSVNDIVWDPSGSDFIVSVSSDKTARLYAAEYLAAYQDKHFHDSFVELFRPQVHGHAIFCSTLANANPRHSENELEYTSLALISGAEEKVLRVFKAPGTLDQIVRKQAPPLDRSAFVAASVPELGLSNKPMNIAGAPLSATGGEPVVTEPHQGSNDEEDEEGGASSSAAPKDVGVKAFGAKSVFSDRTQQLSWRPLEDELLQHRLWPEVAKLYSHGNDLLALCSSRSGKYLASSCKSSEPKHSSIVVWMFFEAKEGMSRSLDEYLVGSGAWQELQKLPAHELSVQELAFSEDEQFLLSVGRDRAICLFRKEDGDSRFQLFTQRKEAHTRIINCCAWLSCSKHFIFVTGSRDKKMKFWTVDAASALKDLAQVTLAAPVTSLACVSPSSKPAEFWLAVGLETGKILIYIVQLDDSAGTIGIKHIEHLHPHLCAGKRVNRLVWQPSELAASGKERSNYQLAVASADCSVRVVQFSPIN